MKDNNTTPPISGGGALEAKVIEITLEAGGQQVTEIGEKNILSVWVDEPIEGVFIEPVAAYDEEGVSTRDGNIYNKVYTDLVYNNSRLGTTNLGFVGLDLGEVKDIGRLDIYWYNPSFWGSFYIEYKDNAGDNWKRVGGGTVFNAEGEGVGDPPQVVEFEKISARFIRQYFVSGADPRYLALRELEAFSPPAGTVLEKIASDEDYSIISVNNRVSIQNNKTVAANFKVYYYD